MRTLLLALIFITTGCPETPVAPTDLFMRQCDAKSDCFPRDTRCSPRGVCWGHHAYLIVGCDASTDCQREFKDFDYWPDDWVCGPKRECMPAEDDGGN